jgi:hypothetical protein
MKSLAAAAATLLASAMPGIAEPPAHSPGPMLRKFKFQPD